MKKLIGCFLFAALIGTAMAESTKLIVPFTQGGNADQLARLIQKHVQQDINHNIVVDFRPGASGEIGTAFVANSDSKDLVLLLNGPSMAMTSLLKDKLSYNENNLVPLVHLGHVPFVLVVSKKSGIRTFKDLQNLDPQRSITYASGGVGTATHMAGATLHRQLGKNFIHVPYKGSGQVIPDLISGNVDALIIHWTAVAQHIQADQITALAIESETRLSPLPGVPTFKEFGISNSGRHGYLVLYSNQTAEKKLQSQIQKSVLSMITDPGKNTFYKDFGFVSEKNPIPPTDFIGLEKQKYQKVLQIMDLK